MPHFSDSIRRLTLFVAVLSVLSAVSSWHARNATAAPTSQAEIEVLLAKASLLFHSKKEAECLRVLDTVLSKDESNKNALELKALVFKSQNNDDKAAETYLKLIEVTPREKAPPYHFELATVLFKQKKFDEAEKHYTISARKYFNKGTSHFFAGMANTNQKDWVRASKNFGAALLYADASQMKPVARYYLATAQAQTGKSTAAIRNYVRTAFDIKEAGNDSPMAAQFPGLKKNAIETLRTFNQEQFFATATYMQQWDNNVTLMPYTVTTGQQASGKQSLKSVISAVFGYTSSPTKKFQFIPSNTIYTNYNYNYESREMNFFSDTPSFYLFYKPYNRLASGIKIEGTYNMKRQLSVTDGSYKYRPYSFVGDIGPLLRYEALPTVNLGLEVTYKPKRYYRESKEGEDRRTGRGIYTKFSTEFNSEYYWLTPTVTLTFEWDDTLGTSYRSRSYGLNLSNPIDFTDKLTLTPSLDVLSTDYYKVIPNRTELLFTAKTAATYDVNSEWSLLGEASFARNNSTNSASFTYTRAVASLGASYSF